MLGSDKMNYGFDYGDTLSFEPERLGELCRILHVAGNRIYIISALSQDETTPDKRIEFLQAHNIPFDAFISVWEPNAGQKKAEACSKYNIDIMVDDNEEWVHEIKQYNPNTIVFHLIREVQPKVKKLWVAIMLNLFASLFNKV